MTFLKLIFTIFILIVSSQSHAGVLLQGFYWDAPSAWDSPWWDKLSDEATSLSDAGFTAIWIPPVLKGASGGYSNGYDPFDDYDLGSKDQRSTYGTRWGTREQLMRMIAVMRANGMDVYFDNVLGHRSGDDGQSNFVYKDAFGNNGGGRFQKSSHDFSGYNSFGRQVNYFNSYTKNNLIQSGDWLINALGVQGQRIDMATNVAPEFLRDYLNSGAMAGKFAVSEYWSENLNELEHYVTERMQGRVSAFDFPLWGRLKDMTNAGGFYDLRTLISAGLNSRKPNHSVTFVENHDTDRGFPTTQNKHLAYAFILTTEGYPSVFWKDYFNYSLKNILDPLIWIHEKFAHGPINWRHTDPDLLIYERDSKPGLLVVLNDNQSFEKNQWVQTNFGSFVELHDYTGNAPNIRTEADGRVNVTVPKNSYVAYSPKGFHWGHEKKSHRTHQQFAGAKDLDIPPAITDHFQNIGRIYVASNTPIHWILHQNNSSLKNLKSTKNPNYLNLILKDHKQNIVANQKINLESTSETGEFKTLSAGWYEFQIKLISENPNLQIPFWLNVDYMAPQK